MAKKKELNDVIQTSITMERHLKEKYSRLACQLDLSFSQLVRYSLEQVDRGLDDYAKVLDKKASSFKSTFKTK